MNTFLPDLHKYIRKLSSALGKLALDISDGLIETNFLVLGRR
jgi:hypothetical protein